MASDTLLQAPIEPPPEAAAALGNGAAAVPKPIITLAIIFFFVYLTFGVLLYILGRDQFSGETTNLIADAFYFSIVTMSTVGYGDIVPLTQTTKILTVVLVVMGVGFLNILLSLIVNHILDLQENAILSCITRTRSSNAIRDHIVDVENERIRTVWKLCLAICAVGICVGVGIWFLRVHENVGFWDSVYLSVISVTSVGYGDLSFKTCPGRVFASVWLLLSTIAMDSLFYYFAEMRIDRTVMKLPTSDQSELILSRLREKGKISDADIEEIRSELESRSSQSVNEDIQ